MRKIFTITLPALVLGGAVVWWGVSSHRAPRPVSSPAMGAGGAASRSSTASRIANSHAAIEERLKATREISFDLNNEELRELLAALSKPIHERNRENDLLALNELMNRLRITGLAAGEYATALCKLIRDTGTHPVVRDYAVQHAVQWMHDARGGQAPASISEEDRQRLMSCMALFLESESGLRETGFGTTLNALRTLATDPDSGALEILEISGARIFAIAAGRETGPLANRIACVQCLPFLPDRESALETVRALSADAPGGSPLRLVAIATLGDLGNPTDLASLRQLQNQDSRVSYAARSAADRLQRSLPSSSAQ